MKLDIGVVMDPIGSIVPSKDSTLALLLAAQQRQWRIHYIEQGDLWLRDGRTWAASRRLSVADDLERWCELGEPTTAPLDELDVVLMRKDPPFNIEYIYTTYLLELAESRGTLVLNRPQSLRDANEKMFAAWFPGCTPPTLVTRRHERLRAFLAEHREVVIKPLDGMGGQAIFRVSEGDANTTVILETMTAGEQQLVMAQRFIPEITAGDKRIILVDGEPVPHALARVPAEGDFRGNLAAGAVGRGVELSERDRWICQQIGPTLRDKGLVFVGLDVIGDYLTEVNVTSPTGIRELDRLFELNISSLVLDAIERRLPRR